MIGWRAQGQGRIMLQCGAIVCFIAVAISGCSSVPGETLASGGVKRDVGRRVLAQAHTAVPGCKDSRIADTEVLELHPDGKVEVERWTVEHCGQRLNYRVIFPAKGPTSAISIRPE